MPPDSRIASRGTFEGRQRQNAKFYGTIDIFKNIDFTTLLDEPD